MEQPPMVDRSRASDRNRARKAAHSISLFPMQAWLRGRHLDRRTIRRVRFNIHLSETSSYGQQTVAGGTVSWRTTSIRHRSPKQADWKSRQI